MIKPLEPHTISYVFVDRDGVLNRKMPEGFYVSEWVQFEWLPGAFEAVRWMNQAGLIVVLVTNQRGVALGFLSEEQLNHIHAKMESELARRGAHLDAIYYCPHDRGQCHCRKPETGLFEEAFRQFPKANPQNSIVIGDSLSDIQAGKRLGMKTIFIRGEAEFQKPGSAAAAAEADFTASSLLDAVGSYPGFIHRRASV